MAGMRDFDRLTPFIAAFRPFLTRQVDETAKEAYDEMIKNWEQGANAKGKPWEPLAPSTIQQKGHATPLIETRQMINSASYDFDKGELAATISIEDEEGKVLTHEYGAPDQGIPPRPILAPTRDLIEENADQMLKDAFDRTWASAAVSGTALSLGYGGGKLGGGGRR